MQRVFAIIWLTWKAAFRFRLFLVVAALLLLTVVVFPLLIKDDGTARGFTQIVLTYTLSTIAALLGLSTLWLACGTLARDIEECQMQVVATKPIARWQIWIGKYLGILTLNAALLALSGASVYALLQFRATRLPPEQQHILRSEVLVARGSAREASLEQEIQSETDRLLRERLARSPVSQVDLAEVRKQIYEQVKAEYQLVQPGYIRVWEINLGPARHRLRDKPLQIRFKYNSADRSPSGTFTVLFQVGVPDKTPLWRSEPMSVAPDTFHEFEIPPNLFDADGLLTISALNPNNTSLLFPLDEGMEVLYPQGGFAPNYLRGLGIIFCWMAVLAALGLAAASLMSFPVAAFFSLSLLALVFFSGTMASAVAEGTIAEFDAERGTRGSSPADVVVIPTFKALLAVINLVKNFSPVDSLSTGRSITWGQLGLAFAQIVVLLGGLLCAAGIAIFHRRELATAQATP